ncbi:MAG: hypothetical protein JWM33_2582, partial [Caulobacteraceae bacterium]|nr:hypothetical protein [Caulobacteraceae bacterium]
ITGFDMNSSQAVMAARWILAAAVLAAVPSLAFAGAAPESLASQAAGVLGSGDQIALQLKSADGASPRVLKIGEMFEDGWKLDALTPTSATLARDGERREVGLNPTGALAETRPGATPSQVIVTPSAADLALIEGRWDGKAQAGLTVEETQRYLIYGRKIAAVSLSLGGPAALIAGRFTEGDIRAGLRAAMGDAAFEAALADNDRLDQKHMGAMRQAAVDQGDINQVRSFDGLPAIGPDSFYIPQANSATGITDAIRAAGLVNLVGYSLGPLDASGGRTVTKTLPRDPPSP